MKKLFKVVVVAALFFGTVVSAADDSRLSLISGENKSLIFSVDTQFQDTSVRLFTEEGELIFLESVTGEALYSKRFNLNNLERGNYSFTVENSLKEVVYSIVVTESEASIVAEKENVKPVFRKKDGKVYMNFLNLEKENVSVQVYDSSDRILFQETISNEIVVEKSFNFVDAVADSYTVAVYDGENTYYETILVK
jgi:hypothetical protein